MTIQRPTLLFRLRLLLSLFAGVFVILTQYVSAACIGSYCNDPNDSPATRLLPKTAIRNSFRMGYYEYLPKQYSLEPTRKFPVIIHAHGVGEGGSGTGTDLDKVLKNGVPKFIKMGHNMTFTVNGKEEAFIVLMPQANGGRINPTHVEIMLEWAKANYRIDTSRVYMMGLSAGGAATWRYAGNSTAAAASLAAISPSCGALNNFNGQSQTIVNTIASANLPVRAYHGTGDTTISYNWSTSVVDSINAYIPTPKPLAKITLYPGVGHNVWDKSMDPKNPDSTNVYKRFLQYTNQRGTTLVAQNQAPVANAGVDQTITLPTNSVTLNGGLSKDNDGIIRTYGWRQVSGPSTSTIVNAASISTVVNNLVAGKYEYELVITDDKGATAGDRILVTVNSAVVVSNQAPVANAGVDQTITQPTSSVTLNGGLSKDNDGTIRTYGWRQVSGPSTSTIVSAASVSTTVNNLTVGTYVYELKVADDKGATAVDTISVIVKAATTSLPAGCSRVLVANDGGGKGFYYDANTLGIKPGEVVCINAGSYTYLRIANLSGTASQPIVIKNINGVVELGTGFYYGMNFINGKHFRVLGNGVSGVRYGFKVALKEGSTSVAVGMGNSSDFELAYIDISRAGVGIMAKVNTSCDPMSRKENYLMRNVKIHDVYVHDVEGEGFYIGNTSISETVTCDGQSITKEPAGYNGVEIYNVKMERLGWDGIQLARVQNAKVYNNTVSQRGLLKNSSHAAGILLGGFSNGRVFNNILTDGHSAGVQYYGVGESYIYNNIINRAGQGDGQDGIYVSDRPLIGAGYPLQKFNIFNNTIIAPKRNGITVVNTKQTIDAGNIVQNNVLIGHLGGGSGYAMGGTSTSLRNNATFATIQLAGLDTMFAPISNSLLVDGGLSVAIYGVNTDVYGAARQQGNATDIGAVESIYSRITTTTTVNQAPVANAGVDQTITLPTSSVTLNGGLSKDNDGTIRTYGWRQVSGPSTSTIVSAASVSTTVNNLTVGTYVYELKVADDKGATAVDTISVIVKAATTTTTVTNIVPTITMYGTQTITLPFNSAAIYGVGRDSDGSIKLYQWKQISGPSSATIEQPTNFYTRVANLIEGVYVFELTATDNGGLTISGRVTITVKKAITSTNTVVVQNQAPVANAGTDQIITLPTSSVTLNGGLSKDSDGTIRTYSWRQVSGPSTSTITNAASVSTSVSNLIAGRYEYELVITDDKGATAGDRIIVTVSAPVIVNQAPVANAGVDQTITLPTSSVTLNGGLSKDNDGTIKTYGWRQVSGPSTSSIIIAASVSTTVSNLVAGTYEYELVITDDAGSNASDRVVIIVNPAAVFSSTKRRVLIDLGSDPALSWSVTSSPDINNNYWNSMNSFRVNDTLQGVVDVTNAPTSLYVKVIRDIFANHSSSPIGINVVGDAVDVGDYPASAVRDNAFARSATASGQWVIGGLSPQKTYTIKFWGNRNATDNRTIQMKLSTDTVWQEYNASKNTNYNHAAIIKVSGLSEALIDIRVKAGSTFGNISIIDILEE